MLATLATLALRKVPPRKWAGIVVIGCRQTCVCDFIYFTTQRWITSNWCYCSPLIKFLWSNWSIEYGASCRARKIQQRSTQARLQKVRWNWAKRFSDGKTSLNRGWPGLDTVNFLPQTIGYVCVCFLLISLLYVFLATPKSEKKHRMFKYLKPAVTGSQ